MNRSLNLGMRMICLVICLVCLLTVILPAAADQTAPEEQPSPQTMTTVVHLRASASAALIGQLENGTGVTVLGEQRDFYKIDCYDMVGYVAKNQIAQAEEKYYVNCDPASSETRWLTYTDHAEALALRHSLMALADQQIGSRYGTGGMRPGRFDCSGLMYYVYGQHDIGLHRSAAQQMQDGIVVPRDGLQVGDLVFFYQPGGSYPSSHVGMYVGNNKMIHSASAGVVLTDLDEEYYAKYYLCARRIINADAPQLEQPTVEAAASELLTTNGVSGRAVN